MGSLRMHTWLQSCAADGVKTPGGEEEWSGAVWCEWIERTQVCEAKDLKLLGETRIKRSSGGANGRGNKKRDNFSTCLNVHGIFQSISVQSGCLTTVMGRTRTRTVLSLNSKMKPSILFIRTVWFFGYLTEILFWGEENSKLGEAWVQAFIFLLWN